MHKDMHWIFSEKDTKRQGFRKMTGFFLEKNDAITFDKEWEDSSFIEGGASGEDFICSESSPREEEDEEEEEEEVDCLSKVISISGRLNPMS